jgi:uncharacterized alpha-E superfamily protein
MLSRVAESLYWMSRYIERAEDLTRILAVNFLAQLDASQPDSPLAWQPLVAITGDEALFRECFGEFNAQTVTEFCLWHPANSNAVTACLTRARENARGVREQISSEMWEYLNRLYFLIRNADRAAVLNGPHEFFRQMRDGSQAFQGITAATMTHGEAFEFIQLGQYHERASETVRILDVKYAAANTLPEGSPEAALQLIATLKSCSAFEPFRKTHAAQLQAWRVAEYLLLNREFPRAVAFCLQRCLRAVNALAADPARPAPGGLPSGPQRAMGRMCAELDYVDILDLLRGNFHVYLNDLLKRINLAGDEITRAFFNTQVILPDPRAQQAQQQQ